MLKNNLKEILRKRKISVKKLSYATSIAEYELIDLIIYQKDISLDKSLRIASYLELKLDDIFSYNKNKNY